MVEGQEHVDRTVPADHLGWNKKLHSEKPSFFLLKQVESRWYL